MVATLAMPLICCSREVKVFLEVRDDKPARSIDVRIVTVDRIEVARGACTWEHTYMHGMLPPFAG